MPLDSTIPKVFQGQDIDLPTDIFPQVTIHGKKGAKELDYIKLPLNTLPEELAISFCKELYSESERFFQGYYRYYIEILNLPPDEALKRAREEREQSLKALLDAVDDPHYSAIGFYSDNGFVPTALYGFRPIQSHPVGQTLVGQLNQTGDIRHYSGKLAFTHNFSALNGFRNIALMRFVFVCIAVDAVTQGYDYLFFFMSDHRLGRIYKHFGLDFPSYLKLPDSEYLVGSYNVSAQYRAIYQEVFDLDLAAPEATPTNIQLNDHAKKILYLDKP